MRSLVPNGVRSCLVAFLAVGLMNLPLMAASSQPLGMVVTAQKAHLGNANAEMGTDLYSGDALVTDQGGSIRMKVGASQVYLLSSSAATLRQHDNIVQAAMDHGTLGFSTTTPGQFEIETPLGVVRGANGQRVFGQVAVLSSKKLQVTAYEGTLVVDTGGGEEKTIGQGQTYSATLAEPSNGGGNAVGAGGNGIIWTHVLFVAAPLVAAGLVAFFMWPESCSNPCECNSNNC